MVKHTESKRKIRNREWKFEVKGNTRALKIIILLV